MTALLVSLSASFRSRAALQLEILALRHQIGVLQRSVKRPKLTSADRLLWAWLCSVWQDWQSAVYIMKASTVIGWQRKGFPSVLDLEDSAWEARAAGGAEGSSRVDSYYEPRKSALGSSADPRRTAQARIEIGENSVSKYMVRRRRPPSQTWRTFLDNHVKSMVSVDFFTVPTIRFQILYVFLVLAHDRRRILHFGVTARPTAEWTVQQLREAFPWDTAPRYLLRDRDRIFGKDFVDQVKQVLSAPRSPWQRAYVERVIGTIRRECLDHMIVLNERCLHRHLKSFIDYYHRSRTHLALEKDSPEPRPIQAPESGRIIAIPEVGGLHHRYERRAA
jgi:putative transposase